MGSSGLMALSASDADAEALHISLRRSEALPAVVEVGAG